MTDWNSPEIIAEDAAIFLKLMHALIGLYCWEWFTSLDFDWEYLTGQRKFRWPLIFYFLDRYCLLLCMIGIAIALNVTTEVNCQALYEFNAIMGNFGVGFASINLALRCMAVWSKKMIIVVPLVVLILGHWSLLMHGVLITAMWVPGQGCVITSSSNKVLSALFIYSTVLDFTILCLTGYKLLQPSSGGRSRLVTLIFRDGLIYFIVAFLANVITATFDLLDLNPVMTVITNVPSGIVVTTMATRAVRRLIRFTSQGAELYTGEISNGSTLAFKSRQNNHNLSTTKLQSNTSVHVKMERFEKYDAAGNVVTDKYDLENQEISSDFKKPSFS